jgi:microcystin-dependent protein
MNALQIYGVLNNKVSVSEDSSFDGKYNSLTGQPQINGITLTGNKTLADLGISKAITDAIGNVTQISFEAVNSFADLPVIGEVGVLYLVPNSGSENNNYDEYIWNVNGFKYELIGTIQSDIDLSNYYTKVQVDELINQSPSGQSDCAPVGSIISFMGLNAPTGYLKCDGTVYNISQYQELANHFKSNFGNAGYFGGNGSSTFAVPDLRGEFLRGVGTATRDTGSGADVAGTHQNGTVQPFCAGISNENDCWITSGNYDIVTNPDKTNGDSKKWVMAQSDAYPFPNNGRNINSFVSRPTNTSVLYCIKYKKIV